MGLKRFCFMVWVLSEVLLNDFVSRLLSFDDGPPPIHDSTLRVQSRPQNSSTYQSFEF